MLMTLDAAARHLQVSPRSVRREIAQGKLTAIRVRNRLRIREEDLQAYLDAQKEKPCPSVSVASVTRSELVSVADSVSRKLSPQAPHAPKRARSKLHSLAARSQLQLVVVKKSLLMTP
jgi:excisionase family DNA binding protein